MFKRLIILLAIGLFLGGCGSSDSEDTTELESSAPTATPQLTALVQQSLPDELILYTDEDALYLLQGDVSQVVAEGILPAHVYLSPSKTKLIYVSARSIEHEHQIFSLNLASMDATLLMTLNNMPIMHSWSPNEEWVVFIEDFGSPRFVAKVDGSQLFKLGERPQTEMPEDMDSESGIATAKLTAPFSRVYVVWLYDNTLLVYEDHFRQEDGMRDMTTIYQFDPYLDEKEILDISENTFQIYEFMNSWDNLNTVDRMLEPFNLGIARTEDPTAQIAIEDEYSWVVTTIQPDPDPINYRDFPACANWSIVQKPARQSAMPVQLYKAHDTYLLSDLQILNENEFLFVQWQIDNCLTARIATATILYIQPNDDVIKLTQTTAVANTQLKSGRRSLEVTHNHIMDVALDDSAMVFIRNDETASTSSIVVMDIMTQQEQIIYETDEVWGITNVFWAEAGAQ